MRVLLIKTSSMGDIIHLFPALTDAGHAIPNIKFDWVVEESFVELPKWHPQVNRVIPVAIRQWRKAFLSAATRQSFKNFRTQIQKNSYDLVLDAQGLVKSAVLSYFAQGERVGLNWNSARESLASLFYQRKLNVDFKQHAVQRMRLLMSQALGYELDETPPDFGIDKQKFVLNKTKQKYVVFLHSTTWSSKLWPEKYWQKLAKFAEKSGFRIMIGGGSDEEVARATRIANHSKAIDLVPRLSIGQMATLLSSAAGAIAVDTGFGHLSAALGVPTVSLYGSTNPEYTGALGDRSVHLSALFACSPCLSRRCNFKGPAIVAPACFASLSPERVWKEFERVAS